VKTVRLLFTVLTLVFSGLTWAASIDINSADAKTLESLDGIGPAKAHAIVEYREKNGPFKSVDELEKVSGIGKATLEKNRDKIAVSSVKAAAKSDRPRTSKKSE